MPAVHAGDGDRRLIRPLGAVDERNLRDLGADAALRVLTLTIRMRSVLDVAMRDQADPDVLDSLYGLDALGCQARRAAENLHVLTGVPIADPDRQVTSMADVLAAALGRIVGWDRVTVGAVADIAVIENVSGDLIRVMTELLDNAVRYSTHGGPVTASAHLLYDGGVLLRVEDTGIGFATQALARSNALLRSPHTAGPMVASSRGGLQQGLHVVCRAAGAHDIRVSLAGRSPQGTTAMVYVPPGLLTEIPTGEADTTGADDGQYTATDVSASRPAPRRPVPVRVPQRLRDLYPVRPPAARGTHPAPDPAGSLDQIAAFDAATRAPAAKDRA